ncbi:MAG TPA: SDR family oxidoreductase [Vicinamibacterales bacterium]|jgi:short-subunit dehydrogenase
MEPRTIVITGASSGIGAALSLNLGALGHRLIISARRRDELETLARRAGPSVMPIVADVTRRADVERLKDQAIATFGRVDVWVNNAGRGITRQTLDLTDAEFDEMMAVNVKSALYGMQVITPHFLERGMGHIINVSSFLSRVPIATYRSGYNAAKAALNALTANVRMDLAAKNKNIHVTLVMPGLVSTDFARNALGGLPSAPTGAVPQAQTAEEVAAVIADVIRNPVAEVYTNPQQAVVVQRYFADVAAFERDAISRQSPVVSPQS